MPTLEHADGEGSGSGGSSGGGSGGGGSSGGKQRGRRGSLFSSGKASELFSAEDVEPRRARWLLIALDRSRSLLMASGAVRCLPMPSDVC